MIIGYARVSTTEQNLDLQRDALKRAGCEKIIEDTVSGGKVQRPGLERVHDALRSGDVLAVWPLCSFVFCISSSLLRWRSKCALNPHVKFDEHCS